MRTPQGPPWHWEGRLLTEYLEALDAARVSRDLLKRLYAVAQAAPGTPDGALAMAQAREIITVTHKRLQDAFDAFNRALLDTKIRDEQGPEL